MEQHPHFSANSSVALLSWDFARAFPDGRRTSASRDVNLPIGIAASSTICGLERIGIRAKVYWNGEGSQLRAASTTACGRGKSPSPAGKMVAAEHNILENVTPLTWRPMARPIYSDHTVAARAGDLVMSSSRSSCHGARA